VEYRSELIYQIMVRRGIVIPEFDEVMNAPPDATPTDPSKPQEPPKPDLPSSVGDGVTVKPERPEQNPPPAGEPRKVE
jgi:hypothetical protein